MVNPSISQRGLSGSSIRLVSWNVRGPSIHPSSSAYPGSGRGGSSLSREAQTSSPQLLRPALPGGSRGVPRPAERHSLSSVSWVFPGVSYQWDVP